LTGNAASKKARHVWPKTVLTNRHDQNRPAAGPALAALQKTALQPMPSHAALNPPFSETVAAQFGAPTSYWVTCQMIDIQPDQVTIRQGSWRIIDAICDPSQFHNMPDKMK
jgi:hypothetical protein